MILLAALLFVLAALYWGHHLFEGERLIPDMLRERRLARLSLAQLDAQWELAEKSDIVVSLTTIPSRIAYIDQVLKGLLDQSRPPRQIVLNVPEYSLRETAHYDVPEHLQTLASVNIRRCQDSGPATKMIPTVLDSAPDQLIVVVDDDRIYPWDFLATFEAAASVHPDAALTMAGWVVPDDLTDRPTTAMANLLQQPPAPIRGHRLRRPRPVDVLMGVFGYAVRPKFFDRDALTDFSDAPKAVFLVDDVRSSALCTVPKLAIPCRSLSFLPKLASGQYKVTALGRLNRGDGTLEDRNNTKAIRHFAAHWRVGGQGER